MEIIFEGVVFLYPQIFADLLIYQLGGADHAHHITIVTPGFSDLPTALTLGHVQAFLPNLRSKTFFDPACLMLFWLNMFSLVSLFYC